MKSIRVGKVYIKDMTGANGAWKSYSVKEEGTENWFGLKGFGKDRVKEGDKITGNVTERQWEGKTYKDLNLLSPEIADLMRRVEKLEQQVGDTEPLPPEPKEENEEIDLPF